jgi:hypothetical protein
LPSCKINLKKSGNKKVKLKPLKNKKVQTSSSDHKKQREHGLFFKKFNSFLLPGLYCIINKKNKRRYIVEAGNLANRCSEHYTK